MVVDHGNYQYKYFKATVPEQNISVGGRDVDQRWRFFDYGPKTVPPLVCLGGVAATADVFYKPILALSAKGYRVLSVDAPAVWTHQKWLTSFDQFLDSLKIYEIHLYGTSLGGFLAQLYAQHRPRRILSLILSNTFLGTRPFHVAFSPWSTVFPWTPDFVLKRLILSGLREGPHEPLIADAIDFVVARLERLGQSELASRLVLNTQEASVGHIQLDDAKVTIMDSLDYAAVPSALKDALCIRYPNARKAFLKSGGDFPFLSRADEVNLHLLLHLRHVGAERSGPSFDEVPVSGKERWPERNRSVGLVSADTDEDDDDNSDDDDEVALERRNLNEKFRDARAIARTSKTISSPDLLSADRRTSLMEEAEASTSGSQELSDLETVASSTAAVRLFWGAMEEERRARRAARYSISGLRSVAQEGENVSAIHRIRSLDLGSDVKRETSQAKRRDSSFEDWASRVEMPSVTSPPSSSGRVSQRGVIDDPLGALTLPVRQLVDDDNAESKENSAEMLGVADTMSEAHEGSNFSSILDHVSDEDDTGHGPSRGESLNRSENDASQSSTRLAVLTSIRLESEDEIHLSYAEQEEGDLDHTGLESSYGNSGGEIQHEESRKSGVQEQVRAPGVREWLKEVEGDDEDDALDVPVSILQEAEPDDMFWGTKGSEIFTLED